MTLELIILILVASHLAVSIAFWAVVGSLLWASLRG